MVRDMVISMMESDRWLENLIVQINKAIWHLQYDLKEFEMTLEELRKARAEVKGTECEVYSRVVGYLRPVKGWNVGKREEYKMRKLYNKIGEGSYNDGTREDTTGTKGITGQIEQDAG